MRFSSAPAGLQAVLRRLPVGISPALPPNWLRCEMLERYEVLRHSPVDAGSTVLEVGSGSHAITTIPLAVVVGPRGKVLAAERARWTEFRRIVGASGVGGRIRPVACDARRLPLRDRSVALAICLHGIRSLGDDAALVATIREMFRVAPRVVLAETLPVSTTNAQAAHLAMYGLREEVLWRKTGRPDDRAYRPIERVAALAELAGGEIEATETLEVDLPHALAGFPRALVEALPPGRDRDRLLRQWDDAAAQLRAHGEDHPPVGIVCACRRPGR